MGLSKTDILIVDDEADIRSLIRGILEDEGYRVREASGDREAYKAISERVPSLVILDIWLQNSQEDGLKILSQIKKDHPGLPVLMISGHGTIETAVSAIKDGAYDFIEKPFKSDRLLLMIERALETAALRKENARLREQNAQDGGHDFVGNAASTIQIRQTLERIAVANSRVLITGDAGTGKEIVARYIHKKSTRSKHPFVVINCAILRPERLETELFGSETSVNGEPPHTGVLEHAHTGTLLLDEVADMPIETQGKILRVLQDQKFQRFGGQEQIEVDVRIIASSNKDLKQAIANGDFREDLYYRLNVVPVQLPRLTSRIEDLRELALYFMQDYSKKTGIPVCQFSEKTFHAMESYDWPGNVRQLKNAVEWIMITKHDKKNPVEISDLPPDVMSQSGKNTDANISARIMAAPLREARELFEKEYLELQVKRFDGNISKTAEYVGMERSALHRKMKQLGIDKDQMQETAQTDVQEKEQRSA